MGLIGRARFCGGGALWICMNHVGIGVVSTRNQMQASCRVGLWAVQAFKRVQRFG